MLRKPLFLAFILSLSACGTPSNVASDPMGTPVYIKAVGLLQAHFRSTDPAIRCNCVEALQPAKDPRAKDVIEEGLHDDAWVVRFASAMAAGKRREHDLLPTLESLAVSDPSGSVQAASIYALHRMDRNSDMNILASLIRSNDTSTRANTAMILGMMGDPGTIPLLRSLGSDPDDRAHFEITAALARLGDESAQKALFAESISKFGEDQWHVMEVCADLPRDVALGPLMAGLQGIPDNVHVDAHTQGLTTARQLKAAASLAKLHNGEGADVSIKNLNNKEPGMRALALLALGEMLTPEQLKGIAGYLTDPDDGVKIAAAAAIINVFSRGLPLPPSL